MMRVLIDANVWLSYFVNLRGNSTIPRVVRACLSPEIELLVPQELISELRRILSTKPYFKKRISTEAAKSAIDLLQRLAEIPPRIDTIDRYVDDPDDDYLIAYGLMYDVDYLVTGDAAVRMLEQVENLRIVRPAEFLEIAKQARLV